MWATTNEAVNYAGRVLPPSTTRLFSVVSLFCGCGGSSLGYAWAGGEILAGVDVNEAAIEVYSQHIGAGRSIVSSVSVWDSPLYMTEMKIKAGELDILDGSPPCQGFSTAGNRDFWDPRNELFHEYVRILREVQPKVFIMENVDGLVRGNMKHIFAQMMRDLKNSGYQVSASVLDAAYFGVPQHRRRLIVIGARGDLEKVPTMPRPTSGLISFKQAMVGVTNTEEDLENASYKPESACARVLRLLKPGQSGSEVLGDGHYFNMARCAWDQPTRTVLQAQGTSSVACGTCYPTGIRRLTIPEVRRVMGFPDAFTLDGLKTSEQWSLLGNAVPPPFMQAIAEHAYQTLLKD